MHEKHSMLLLFSGVMKLNFLYTFFTYKRVKTFFLPR